VSQDYSFQHLEDSKETNGMIYVYMAASELILKELEDKFLIRDLNMHKTDMLYWKSHRLGSWL